MPLGMLKQKGFHADTMDVSVEPFDAEKALRAEFIGISTPMHTALRIGVRVAGQIRKLNQRCHICFYGLYASLNSEYLLDGIADSVIGGEYEEALAALIESVCSNDPVSVEGVAVKGETAHPVLERLEFTTPERGSLPSLDKYARLEIKGEERLAGYVEASRGCLHSCTHCPIPPVYNGRFFIVAAGVVIEDVRRLVQSGARHITFGDPDFLNGPGHSLKVARALHEEFPHLTFDFTAKVEHLLKHGSLLGEFAAQGCIFIVSAFESMSGTVLSRLDKGHTREDMKKAVRLAREAGITLRPTWVAFTPWTTVGGYIDMLEFVESEGLIDQVDPVQYSIRLLIPPGSLLLSMPETRQWLGPLVQDDFSHTWRHPDPRMDRLHEQVTELVEHDAMNGEDASSTFYRVRELAYATLGSGGPPAQRCGLPGMRLRPPRLTEAWFC